MGKVKTPNLIFACDSGIWFDGDQGEPQEYVEYIRADVHAELVKAADELAAAVHHERNMVCQDFDMQLRAAQAVDTALSAYQSTKEKLK